MSFESYSDSDISTASLYHIRWSQDFGSLRRNFDQVHVVNTSGLSPQEAGSVEKHSFLLSSFNITNGTIVFFAIAAENAFAISSRSEISNIARAVKFVPPPPPRSLLPPPPSPSPHHNISPVAIVVSTVAAMATVIAVIVLYLTAAQKHSNYL